MTLLFSFALQIKNERRDFAFSPSVCQDNEQNKTDRLSHDALRLQVLVCGKEVRKVKNVLPLPLGGEQKGKLCLMQGPYATFSQQERENEVQEEKITPWLRFGF
jgi:hypothetical protein